MAEPNYALLAAIVLAQDTAYNTRHPANWEKICNRVWWNYRNTGSLDVPATYEAEDVAGLGDTIYAQFVAAGLTQGTGGVAYALEQIANTVLTHPYTRSETNVLAAAEP